MYSKFLAITKTTPANHVPGILQQHFINTSANPEAGGAVIWFSARVVERHASACLRTVGVD